MRLPRVLCPVTAILSFDSHLVVSHVVVTAIFAVQEPCCLCPCAIPLGWAESPPAAPKDQPRSSWRRAGYARAVTRGRCPWLLRRPSHRAVQRIRDPAGPDTRRMHRGRPSPPGGVLDGPHGARAVRLSYSRGRSSRNPRSSAAVPACRSRPRRCVIAAHEAHWPCSADAQFGSFSSSDQDSDSAMSSPISVDQFSAHAFTLAMSSGPAP